MKKFYLIVLLCITAMQGFAQANYFLRRPYVQLATHNSMYVCWRSAYSDSSVVIYGTTPNQLTQRAVQTGTRRNHYLNVTGLQPNTKYYYAVVTTGQDTFVQANSYFFTHPVPGTPKTIRLWAHGDMGSYDQRQKDVVSSFAAFNNNQRLDGWLNLGDIIYNWSGYLSGADTTFTWDFFNTYDTIIRNTVCWPSPGNHDYESVDKTNITGPYFDAFVMPKNAEAGGVASGLEEYYSYDIGDVHFVSLCSENLVKMNFTRGIDQTQVNWLKADLAASTAKWKVAYWHASPYSRGSHNSDNFYEQMAVCRPGFVPTLDQYGVDLVLGGHSHNYERSYLIKGLTGNGSTYRANLHLVQGGDGNAAAGRAYIKPKGVISAGAVYVMNGCGGKLNTGDGSLDYPANFMGQDTVAGSTFVEITGDTLRVLFISENGQTLDDFSIIKTQGTTAVDTYNDEATHLVVYPNPSNGELNLNFDLPEGQTVNVQLLDLAGRTVRTLITNKVVSSGINAVHLPDALSNLSSGIYSLRMQAGDRTYYRQVVKD
jgi:acid phosphatase type 7